MKTVLILLGLLLNSSCAWSGMSDYQKARQRYEGKKIQAATLDAQLFGLDRDDVVQVLGNPGEKRNKPYPYFVNSNCTKLGCEEKWADEIWFYEFFYKDQTGRHIYSINVYFINGKVVRII